MECHVSVNRAPLGQYLAGEPMERVEVDILGPLPVTERGNRYILVTRVIVNEYISRFGIPLYCNLIRGDCLKLNFSRISVTSCGLTRLTASMGRVIFLPNIIILGV
jgi:hypothetical protein